eukprot:scaffold2910_cov390-Prasinococcus_capsulatus_cf.AAC.49
MEPFAGMTLGHNPDSLSNGEFYSPYSQVGKQQFHKAVENVRGMEFVGIYEYYEITVCLFFFTFHMDALFHDFCVLSDPHESLVDLIPVARHRAPLVAARETEITELGKQCIASGQNERHSCTTISNTLDAMIYLEALDVRDHAEQASPTSHVAFPDAK